MTTIRFTKEGNMRQLTCNGHSEYAEEGMDIVCAAISIMTFALCKEADLWDGKGIKINEMFISDGITILEYEDEKGILDRCFEMTAEGLKSLSEEYQKNVKIIF